MSGSPVHAGRARYPAARVVARSSARPADARPRARVHARARGGVLGALLPHPDYRGLGVAFRSRPAEVLKVAASAPAIAQALRQEPTLDVAELRSAGRPNSCCEPARSRCSPSRAPAGAVVYRYDDTNPEGRTARMLADRAIQRAAGRADPVPATDEIVREAGLALHRLPGSRPRRPGHHEQHALGPRLLDRRFAPPQADQAPDRDADVADVLPAVVSAVADDRARRRGRRARRFRRAGVRRAGARPLLDLVVICVLASLSFSALGAAHRQPRADDRGACRA